MKNMKLQYEDIFSGELILVNEEHPLFFQEEDIPSFSRNLQYQELLSRSFFPRTQHHAPSFMAVDEEYPDILLQKKAATVLSHMIQDIGGEKEIVPVSGYRSGEEQTRIWEDSIKENGEEFTRKYVALPGHSEHQTGLAIDLGLKKEVIDFIRPDFPYEGICGRFRQIAPEYGFIERYERGKEPITKIAHEPWHFRYVGYPHSKIMKEQGISLEEYIEMLKKFPMEEQHYFYEKEAGRQAEVFFVPLSKKKKAMLSIPEECLYQISGNNVDGCIVTIWRNEHA
ncbi:MAG: M15 family metallopeptidase [Lachnospiraceae bacterium]|nr:M15 family metallopeptidase [Lachnospiraceae bacterium]